MVSERESVMKAADFLKMQRAHVEQLFGELEGTSGTDKARRCTLLANALTACDLVEAEMADFAARRAFANRGVPRSSIEQPGFIEGCIARRSPPPLLQRRVRSFDAGGEGPKTRGLPGVVEEDERELFEKPLACLDAQLEARFREHTSAGQRRLLAFDPSRRALLATGQGASKRRDLPPLHAAGPQH